MKRIVSTFGLVVMYIITTEISLYSQVTSNNNDDRIKSIDSTFSQTPTGIIPHELPPAQSVNALKYAMNKRIKSLHNLEFSADMTVKYQGMTQMGNCDAKLCSSDSMCVTIHGPFGIFVGKMFATPSNFIFYDAFNNQAITGTPSANNIAKTLRIPLSGEDFVHLMRGEAPTSSNENISNEFTISSDRISDTNHVLFVRRSETFGAEYVLFSLKEQVILQFQKKSPDGKILLNVKYSDFLTINDILLAQKIEIQSPENQATALMTLSDFKINQVIPSLRFTIPKGLQTIHLD